MWSRQSPVGSLCGQDSGLLGVKCPIWKNIFKNVPCFAVYYPLCCYHYLLLFRICSVHLLSVYLYVQWSFPDLQILPEQFIYRDIRGLVSVREGVIQLHLMEL